MTLPPAFQFHLAAPDTPLVFTAIHDGHELRPEIAERITLSDQERLREEDPYTAEWTTLCENRVVVTRSRFEVDLNRPRDKAVYVKPEDAWGLQVFRMPLPGPILARSLSIYDSFYDELEQRLEQMTERHGKVVVFDLHSYNHRRSGPDQPPEDPEHNPEINVGTGTMDRDRWAPVVNAFIDGLRRHDFFGRSLDVRENIRFQGGNMGRWVHQTFPRSVCVLSIEVKKIFMDEWTGELDKTRHHAFGQALHGVVPGVLQALADCP